MLLSLPGRFVTQLPSGWIFIIVCVLFRVTEGVGTAMFFTATFATYPKLFPESIGTVVVRNYRSKDTSVSMRSRKLISFEGEILTSALS